MPAFLRTGRRGGYGSETGEARAVYELKMRGEQAGRIATVHVRYTHPESGQVPEVCKDLSAGDVKASFGDAPTSLRLAACAAQFAEVLRRSPYGKRTPLSAVAAQAKRCRKLFDNRADVVELVKLIDKARRLGSGREVARHRVHH